jgi:hypothetical protein
VRQEECARPRPGQSRRATCSWRELQASLFVDRLNQVGIPGRHASASLTAKLRFGPDFGQDAGVASYSLNERSVARARELIEARQYVLESDWGDVQPRAAEENAFLASHSWDQYAEWHLGLTDGASDQTKARYAFVYGDFRRVHRMGLIACHYRAAEWRHKDIELAAHELLQLLDETSG